MEINIVILNYSKIPFGNFYNTIWLAHYYINYLITQSGQYQIPQTRLLSSTFRNEQSFKSIWILINISYLAGLI